jgi:prepilin-type N-terminal cleavage/methylation domain-containing protein
MELRRRPDGDAGFTLVEVLSAMVLFGILVAIAVGPYLRYHKAQQQAGSMRAVVSALRSAQVASVAENSIYRVDFTATAVSSYRNNALSGSWTLVSSATVNDTSVTLTDPSFTAIDGTSSTSCYFYPRGSASRGSVKVGRSGSSKVYTVEVERLTARVSYE